MSCAPRSRNHSAPQRSQYLSSKRMTSGSSVFMIASKAFSTNKKPCADYSVTGLVSLTMACLDYLVMSAYYLEWRTIWPDWLSRRVAEKTPLLWFEQVFDL